MKVSIVAEMEVMQGTDNIDFSRRLTWLQLLMSARCANYRDKY